MKRQRREKYLPVPDSLKERRAATANKWKPEFARQVYFFTLLGATDAQIAQAFNVNQASIDYWKRTKPEFLESVQQGKIQADTKVSHALYLAAIGYSHPDQVIIANKKREFDDKGRVVREWTEPLVVDTIKSYPPNVTAAIKWLQARQPDVWGHKVQIKGQIEHNHKVDLSTFSEEELKILKRLGVHNDNVQDAPYEEIED